MELGAHQIGAHRIGATNIYSIGIHNMDSIWIPNGTYQCFTINKGPKAIVCALHSVHYNLLLRPVFYGTKVIFHYSKQISRNTTISPFCR